MVGSRSWVSTAWYSAVSSGSLSGSSTRSGTSSSVVICDESASNCSLIRLGLLLFLDFSGAVSWVLPAVVHTVWVVGVQGVGLAGCPGSCLLCIDSGVRVDDLTLDAAYLFVCHVLILTSRASHYSASSHTMWSSPLRRLSPTETIWE